MNFGIRYEKLENHVCCVFGCPNTTSSTKFSTKIAFHSFPASSEQRLTWFEAIPSLKIDARSDTTNINASTRVCSSHFASNQFEEATVRGFRRLKPSAIPSVFDNLVVDANVNTTKPPVKDFKSVFEDQFNIMSNTGQPTVIVRQQKKASVSKLQTVKMDLDSSDEEMINSVMFKNKVNKPRSNRSKLDDLTEDDCTPEQWVAYQSKLTELNTKSAYIQALVDRITDNTKSLDSWLKLIKKGNNEIRKRQKLVLLKTK